VYARRGDLAEAEQLAREAVALAETTDMRNWRGNALFDLGEVLRLSGRIEDSVEPLERAVALFEAKGNVVMAELARAALADLALLSRSQ
jgi:tetratricopeptide (TPR) repeat protein